MLDINTALCRKHPELSQDVLETHVLEQGLQSTEP